MTAQMIRDVVIVTDYAYVNGGSAKVALVEAVALARSGMHVTVFSAVGPVGPELHDEPNLSVICLDAHDILSDPSRMRAATRGIWNLDAARAMRDALAPLDPQHTVVHVHSWTKALSSSVLRIAIDGRFPIVMTLHDYFPMCPLGSLYNHRTQEICTLPPMRRRCALENCDSRSYAQKVWRYTRQAVQQTYAGVPARVRHFITLSELSRSVLEPHLPRNASFHAVANPIDVERSQLADPGASDAFSFVGRLSREKGAELFAAAAASIGARAIFVGDGECAEGVRRAYPAADILGWLPRADVERHIRASRAIVFPSLWYEVSPLVIKEAAAVGIPSIVPRTSAAREAIVDGKTGLLFDRADPVDLAAKMQRLADPQVARDMGHAAAERFWAAPEMMEKHLRELLDVYECVLREAA